MHILITGAAGFIGAAVAKRLLDRGDSVHGIDNLNAYYEVSLKEARLARLRPYDNFVFQKLDVADRTSMEGLFATHPFDAVLHMAAQAGVRYSIENPHAYVDANLVGFGNVLEGCPRGGVKHLVFASSSSVYGANTKLPISERDNVDHPVSLYAATKKANELMAHSYAHVFGLRCTGLRFFYGLWPLGAARYGPLQIYRENSARRADPGLQPRPHDAGFHLHRRHRGGRRQGDRPSAFE